MLAARGGGSEVAMWGYRSSALRFETSSRKNSFSHLCRPCVHSFEEYIKRISLPLASTLSTCWWALTRRSCAWRWGTGCSCACAWLLLTAVRGHHLQTVRWTRRFGLKKIEKIEFGFEFGCFCFTDLVSLNKGKFEIQIGVEASFFGRIKTEQFI